MSGGSSRSNSTNQTISEVDNSNTQLNDNEGLVVNLEGAENSEATIIQTDQGSVEQAFDFSRSALDTVDSSVTASLETVDKATETAIDFGTDALDGAFNFGSQALQGSQDFGRDVLSEAQEITSSALQIAGNAQTNAFSKIQEIAQAFTGSRNTLVNVAVIAAVIIGLVIWLRRK